MPYNPQKHNRRSIRLQHYDYSQAGSYFITNCCQNMTCRFGKIVAAEHARSEENPDGIMMELNEFGRIAYDEWFKLPERFPNVELDVFQVMPNHMHGIITLVDIPVGTVPAPAHIPPEVDASPVPTAPSTLNDIVGAYKSLVANACLDIFKAKNEYMGKLWQRDFFEHIIRDKKAYDNISNYIIHNPQNWINDKFYNG